MLQTPNYGLQTLTAELLVGMVSISVPGTILGNREVVWFDVPFTPPPPHRHHTDQAYPPNNHPFFIPLAQISTF